MPFRINFIVNVVSGNPSGQDQVVGNGMVVVQDVSAALCAVHVFYFIIYYLPVICDIGLKSGLGKISVVSLVKPSCPHIRATK